MRSSIPAGLTVFAAHIALLALGLKLAVQPAIKPPQALPMLMVSMVDQAPAESPTHSPMKPAEAMRPAKPSPARLVEAARPAREVHDQARPTPESSKQITPTATETQPAEPDTSAQAVSAPAVVTESKPAQNPAPVSTTAPRFDAAYLNNPAPGYPSQARRMGEQGRVQLRVHVDTNGQAHDVQLATSSGSRALDEAAIQTVRQWRFVPARQGDTAVSAWVIVPIVFKLH